MIAAFSTSSPIASVALISVTGEVLWSCAKESRHQTSAACLEMLQEGLTALGARLPEVQVFAADTGPGSFIGTRVGIVVAKTLAYAVGGTCMAADSFQLIAPEGTVVQPSKRGEYFIRRGGDVPFRSEVLPEGPIVGYGFPEGLGELRHPQAAAFGPLLGSLERISPQALVALHLIEPSISTPKTPFRVASG